MKASGARIDTALAALIASLLISGSMIFASAAFGFLARGATHVTSVIFNHLVLGITLGLVLLVISCFIDYHQWRRSAPYVFVFAIFLTLLVFVPHVGMEHGGGKRWISIARFTFQPSEVLKIATIIIAASYFSWIKAKVDTVRHGLLGFLVIISLPVLILLAQPDLGTLGVILISTGAIYFAAGARVRDIALVILIGIIALSALAYLKPYVRDRITTFMNPAQGQHAESYQIRQSLIAIGSGGLAGRGFGQGVQKFTYLPEPMGDSIFAVASEELGFIGSAGLVILYLAFALRGFAISTHAKDQLGGLLAIGISTYLSAEAFINIASMLGVAPLTGIPLTFISQGGSAMLLSLASAGILLNVSRHRLKK